MGAGQMVLSLRLLFPQVSHRGEFLKLCQCFRAPQTHEEEKAQGISEPVRGV